MEDKSRQRLLALMLTLAFIGVNTGSIALALLTPFGAERIQSVSEIIFWFDGAVVLTLGAYFGFDAAAYFRTRNNNKNVS